MNTETIEKMQVLFNRNLISVLLVEDDAVDRISIEHILTQCDQHTEFATDSAESLSAAVECLNEKEYDVILLDLMLSDSSGLQTVRGVERSNSRIPIVVLTGLDDEQIALSAIRAGAVDYLVKNQVSDHILIRTIRYAIERNQMRQALQDANNSLEIQVEQRTKKLSEVNELLKTEIAARKQIEQGLRSGEANLRKVINTSPDGIIILDDDGVVIFTNSAAELLFDRRPGELDGQTFQFPVVLDETSEIKIEDKAGKVTVAEMNAVQISWKKQNARLVSLHNITERKNAEEEMKEAVEIKSKFVSMASHELRTPLSAIKEGIRLVVQEKTGPLNDEQKEFLDIAKRNVDRLVRLINDVLDFQKLDAGRMDFDINENDINEIAGHVYETMAPAAEYNKLNLQLRLQSDLPKINFDGDRIEQVITNMVGNAMKFTDKGSITIATSKEDNVIQVSVSDTGCGIRTEDLPKVFDEFEQLGAGRRAKAGGAGLGLAISKAIIEQHRGKICVESEYGRGATFHFALPVNERRRNRRT